MTVPRGPRAPRIPVTHDKVSGARSADWVDQAVRPTDPNSPGAIHEYWRGYRRGQREERLAQGPRLLPLLVVAIVVGVFWLVVGIAIGQAYAAAPRSSPQPASVQPSDLSSAHDAMAPGSTGAPQPVLAHGKSTALGVDAERPEVRGSSPLDLGGAPTPNLVRTGWASWYDDGPGFYAALPGSWRMGRLVEVCGFTDGQPRCERAPVITSCLCIGDGAPKVIDLSPALWEAVAGMTAAERRLYGVVKVRVEVLDRG